MLNHEQILQTSDYNFLRERKAHVMTPHNATTCSGVVTSQIYSHGGSRRSTTSGWGPNNTIRIKIPKNYHSQCRNPGGSYRLFYSQF